MQKKSAVRFLRQAAIFACGAILCYAFGTTWFLIMMEGTYTVWQALFVCVVPFLPFEICKIVMAAALVLPVRRLLLRAGVG